MPSDCAIPQLGIANSSHMRPVSYRTSAEQFEHCGKNLTHRPETNIALLSNSAALRTWSALYLRIRERCPAKGPRAFHV